MKEWQKERHRLGKKYRSTTHYVLSALIPYTESNLKLSFKPSVFFNDLEKLDQIKAQKNSVRTAYYRAVKQQLIELDNQGVPYLTEKGLRKVKPYKPRKLKGSLLMVIFDIPETERYKRQRLRLLLKELSFQKRQQSVWVSDKDHRQYLKAEIAEHGLKDYVEVFEARFIKT